jgi:hypothetical protein
MNEENKDLRKSINEDFKNEVPSSNFTHLVMQKVEAAEIKKSARQNPIIGWGGWLIAVILLALIASPVFLAEENSFEFSLPQFNYEKILSTFSLVPAIILAISILIFTDTIIRKKRKKSA